ncbi:hypothetical protein [Hymenobacter crusticola]|uniref:hypothetical protein n=1 Tax=Hymenobacter crusticola TaxID=1770526 RepID=UPI000A3A193F|nr:hypothetical protein [Hymenobacter crusticola]
MIDTNPNQGPLQQLEAYLHQLAVPMTYRGDPYGRGLDWCYFDCFFHEAAVREHFGFGPDICYVAYDGRAAGQEAGFYHESSGFGIMGHHPLYGRTQQKCEITGDERRA